MPFMQYTGRKAVNVRVLGEDESVRVEPGESIPVSEEVLAQTSWADSIWKRVEHPAKEGSK